MSLIERMARAIYETQDNPVPWDSETLGDWRRDYEREKARAALAVVRDRYKLALERITHLGPSDQSAARIARAALDGEDE